MRRSSFQRLALSHMDLLYGAAHRATRNREQAEDLVQETYRVAFQHWRTLREPAACRAWLLRILRNLQIDESRRSRRLVLVDDLDFEWPEPRTRLDPIEALSTRISLQRLEAIVSRLPDDARWLFWLREVEGLSYHELSEILDVPIGTIRSRLARLRMHLIESLSTSERRRSLATGNGISGSSSALAGIERRDEPM